jgi:phosphomannomutase
VGHAFIKQELRSEKGLFAGELSGHYYFRENYCTDSGLIAALKTLSLVAKSGKGIAEILRPFRRYFASGEINSHVKDTEKTLAAIEKKYAPGAKEVLHLDGLSVEFDDWWMNIRPSNTEPVVRLNLEAKTKSVMEKRRDDVLVLIRG